MRSGVKKGVLGGAMAALFLVSGSAAAHNNVEVAGYGGYAFTPGLDVENVAIGGRSVNGHVSFDAAPVFGGLVGYRLEKEGFIYLSYSRTETNAHFREKGDFAILGSRGISLDYFQFGGYIEKWRGPLAPFLGFSLGATRLGALGAEGSNVNLSAVFDAGVKLEILRFLHLRLMGRIPFSFINGESQALCVTGSTCAVTLGGDPLIQAQVLLGLGLGF